jgi:hypothetical protein
MKSMAATEVILIVGILVAVGIILVQLRGIFYSEQILAQKEVAVAFAKDLENILDNAIGSTGETSFSYQPATKKYSVDIRNNMVSIFDKTSHSNATFSKFSPQIIDNYFEDCEKIFVIKKADKIVITCRCYENGENCNGDLICCSGYCNQTSRKCDMPPVCPESLKCLGASISDEPGGNAWKDINGTVCCPFSDIDETSGPVCSGNHCCPTNKPSWCKRPVNGEPRCMSEEEYKTDCKVCKKIYTIVVVANNYADLSAYRSRVSREMQIVREESPFRECPDCLDIKILDLNCPAVCNEYTAGSCASSIISCVNSNYGMNYDLLYAANADNWCNGFSLVGVPFTICGNGVPSEIKDICPIHEIGHNVGKLCDEYEYGYWISEGCPDSGWSQYNLKSSSGCNDFNCGGSESCCGTKLEPSNPSDRTVDIMGGGGGMIPVCSGAYVIPAHFRDFNYNRFKSQIGDYCE